jgi:hypothetical protein
MESPGTQDVGLDYYRNLTASDFSTSLPLDNMFEDHRFWYLATSFDLYFAGIKKHENGADRRGAGPRLPTQSDIQDLASLMPLGHKVVRKPLRALVRILSEEHYQTFAVAYWRCLVRAERYLTGGRFERASSGVGKILS